LISLIPFTNRCMSSSAGLIKPIQHINSWDQDMRVVVQERVAYAFFYNEYMSNPSQKCNKLDTPFSEYICRVLYQMMMFKKILLQMHDLPF
jgi:hypothetical protein